MVYETMSCFIGPNGIDNVEELGFWMKPPIVDSNSWSGCIRPSDNSMSDPFFLNGNELSRTTLGSCLLLDQLYNGYCGILVRARSFTRERIRTR